VTVTTITTITTGLTPERRHLAEREAQAKQGHAQPQHGAGGEFDAGLANAFAGQEVQRHAQQQGEQHDGRAVMLGQKGGGKGHHRAGQHARREHAHALHEGIGGNGGTGDVRHGYERNDRVKLGSRAARYAGWTASAWRIMACSRAGGCAPER
jgi:hypothetical protein